MNKIKIHIAQALILLFALFSISCEDIMSVDSTSSLPTEDHYSSLSEIYGAFIGLSSSFAQVAEQTIILAGLKGDLMKPTANAPEEFWNIYKYQEDNSTTYSSSKKYYDIVLNCNDFLKRVKKYNQDVPGDIPEAVYKGMISKTINLKVWSWLTIGKFWGEASIYSTNMVDNNTDGILRIGFDQLPIYLIDYMNGGEDGIDAFNELDWKWVLDPDSDEATDRNWTGIDLDGRVLMGELNLWAGNYQNTIDYLLEYMKETKKVGNANYSYIFKNRYTDVADAVVTVVPFNILYGQGHNLLSYFSPMTPDLYFVPTDIVVELFDSQISNDYSEGDYSRGRGVSYSLFSTGSSVASSAYISKYMLNKGESENEGQFVSDADIYIYRVSELNLMIAEAYCFMGQVESALTFFDEGVDKYWSGAGFRPPFDYLDQSLERNRGLRDRAGLLKLDRVSVFKGCNNLQDSTRVVSGLIADETALEYAYEGKRWPVLMRMAINLNEPSFLAKRVSRKFGNDAASYEAILNDPKSWFIEDGINDTQK